MNKQELVRVEGKAIRDKKRHKELRPFIAFIRDYNKMLFLSDSDYKKELEEVIKSAQLQWGLEREKQLIKKSN